MSNSIDSNINGANNQLPTRISEQNQQSHSVSKSTGHADSETRTASADKLELTSSARQLQATERNLNAQPAVDPSKVEDIKQRLDSGTYEVDAELVADKLIKLEDLF